MKLITALLFALTLYIAVHFVLGKDFIEVRTQEAYINRK